MAIISNVWPMAPTQRDSSHVTIDGAKLRRHRQLAGKGVTVLAGLAGISQSYLSQIEAGDRPRVSPEVYARLCDALGVTDRTTLMAQPPAPPTP
jgi:transcriptional regulator with XRE-family HTH domain